MKKTTYKIGIDLLMTILLLFLMARQITGDSAHEWLGAGMLILWIAHHILNRSWYSQLFKGRYTPIRILQTVINFAVLLSMFGLMVSGIVLSREVFAFLPISGGIAWARRIHVLSAFWGFVLMSVHLGLHWNMILNMAHKANPSICFRLLRIATTFIAGYGLYAFLKNQFLSYLFLTSSFVFFDFERPVLLFFYRIYRHHGLVYFSGTLYGSGNAAVNREDT